MTRFQMAPESEARFRAVTHKTLHVSHVRQKCACGKQTTAKALTQYGHCPACQKAAEKLSIKYALTTSLADQVLPGTGDRRFTVFLHTWTKAGKV